MELVKPEIFAKCLQLLIDGIEPQFLLKILLNYVLCGNYSGKELLIRILIMEGILAIQQGVHPIILRKQLSSYFGDDFMGEMNVHFSIGEEVQSNKTMVTDNDSPFLAKDTSLLEEPLGRIDNRSLQRLLREIDGVTLSKALSGTSGKIQAKLLKNVPKKLAAFLMDARETADLIIPEIAAAQKKILEIMHVLRKEGDIR